MDEGRKQTNILTINYNEAYLYMNQSINKSWLEPLIVPLLSLLINLKLYSIVHSVFSTLPELDLLRLHFPSSPMLWSFYFFHFIHPLFNFTELFLQCFSVFNGLRLVTSPGSYLTSLRSWTVVLITHFWIILLGDSSDPHLLL